MNLRPLLVALLVSSLGLAGSVAFFHYVIRADQPQADTSMYALCFVVPLAVFGIPGLVSGLSPLSAFPAKLWIGCSLFAVTVFALSNLTWGFTTFPPLDQNTLVMLIAAGPMLTSLLWLWRESLNLRAVN
jgi:hypothetical protein